MRNFALQKGVYLIGNSFQIFKDFLKSGCKTSFGLCTTIGRNEKGCKMDIDGCQPLTSWKIAVWSMSTKKNAEKIIISEFNVDQEKAV